MPLTRFARYMPTQTVSSALSAVSWFTLRLGCFRQTCCSLAPPGPCCLAPSDASAHGGSLTGQERADVDDGSPYPLGER